VELLTYVRAQWDRAGALALLIAGIVTLIFGWIGISGTSFTAEQLPYVISGGIASLFLMGVGGVMWLSADLRDEWRKLDGLEQALLKNGLLPAELRTPHQEATEGLPPASSHRHAGSSPHPVTSLTP
jgi:hypothetical protein